MVAMKRRVKTHYWAATRQTVNQKLIIKREREGGREKEGPDRTPRHFTLILPLPQQIFIALLAYLTSSPLSLLYVQFHLLKSPNNLER